MTDQPVFLNAAIEMLTCLTSVELLETMKGIERQIGRVPSIPNGPRAVDLDLLFYNDESIETETVDGPLIVPHPLLHERDFVLYPLLDIAAEYRHPVLNQTIRQLCAQLPSSSSVLQPKRVLPLRQSSAVLPLESSRTLVMGIINVTPDSFSGDGLSHSLETRIQHIALEMVDAGCDILDVGGESTRPGAEAVSAETETERVVPAIRAIRQVTDCPISVDTTKACVAQAALDSGADLINDVSGGTHDPQMFEVVLQNACPIVLMHRRGTPKTMTQIKLKQYEDVVQDVAQALETFISKAQRLGVPKWNLIVDPGIGFAKDRDLNLQILRNLNQIVTRCSGIPVLVGASRKKFIGDICGRLDPKDRIFGTAATCCAAVQGGAQIIRVHDVPQMIDVIKMSDAIWR